MKTSPRMRRSRQLRRAALLNSSRRRTPAGPSPTPWQAALRPSPWALLPLLGAPSSAYNRLRLRQPVPSSAARALLAVRLRLLAAYLVASAYIIWRSTAYSEGFARGSVGVRYPLASVTST